MSEFRGRDASFALLLGLALGILLQRSRLCFAAAFRDLFLARERRSAVALLAALAVGSVGYQAVFGAQVPDPSRGFVPPNAFIARVAWHTLLGGACFGFGMVIAGGCVSGQLWRLGEGALAAAVALVGVVAGQVAALAAWNALWIGVVAEAPAVWLPKKFGYAGALALQLGGLALLAWLLLRFVPTTEGRGSLNAAAPAAADPSGELNRLLQRVFVERWPAALSGAALGVLATVAFFRGTPLGVTAELARAARALGTALDLLPERLEGIDLMGGCRPPEDVDGLSNPGLFVAALVGGALVAALLAGEFRLRLGRPRALLLGLLGGLFTGFGGFIASGCTIGTLLSGTMAHSLHGPLFAGGLLLGVLPAIFVLRRTAPRARVADSRLDLRGESCGMPTARLEEFLAAHDPRAPFAIAVDDDLTLELLTGVACRSGWRPRPTDVARGEPGRHAEFDPPLQSP